MSNHNSSILYGPNLGIHWTSLLVYQESTIQLHMKPHQRVSYNSIDKRPTPILSHSGHPRRLSPGKYERWAIAKAKETEGNSNGGLKSRNKLETGGAINFGRNEGKKTQPGQHRGKNEPHVARQNSTWSKDYLDDDTHPESYLRRRLGISLSTLWKIQNAWWITNKIFGVIGEERDIGGAWIIGLKLWPASDCCAVGWLMRIWMMAQDRRKRPQERTSEILYETLKNFLGPYMSERLQQKSFKGLRKATGMQGLQM